MAIQGVILDIDGTLVDSNDAHARSWLEVFENYGYHPSFEAVRRLIGMGGDKLLPAITGGLSDESPKGKEMKERRTRLFLKQYLPTVKAFPQARALVQRMRDFGLKIVVGTSANEQESAALIRVAGIGDLIDGATSSDDAERSKPAPDIVEAALAKLELQAGEVIMLGDTPYDLQAAARAGVRLVGLRCGGWGDEDLKGAAAVYQDPAHLLAHLEESPFWPVSGSKLGLSR